jgi:rRNA large subunit m3Psi methyltransferase RlmH|tara:strand:- start:66 stop:500 length:435 start_codon:yes stop_codon:yes gene_type:complete
MGRVLVHLDSMPKDRAFATILRDYEERLSPVGISVKAHDSTKDPRDYEKEISKLSGKLVLLDEEGKTMTSMQLARWLESTQLGRETTHMAIGPHNGFSEQAKESADSLIALSSLTLTHEFSAALLMEQLYRASEIIRGSPYHRG